MIELRRTRVSNFSENKDNFTKLHDLSDAIQVYREKNDEDKLRGIIRPVEQCLDLIPAVIIRDTAIDALCHGAQLAIPGVLAATKGLKERELVGIYTIKGEIVGLAEAAMSSEDIKESVKGIAFHMRRIIMKPGTYPKAWRSNAGVVASGMSTNTKA
jgi:H/ACA ribonucleoprotein complex subunit 4